MQNNFFALHEGAYGEIEHSSREVTGNILDPAEECRVFAGSNGESLELIEIIVGTQKIEVGVIGHVNLEHWPKERRQARLQTNLLGVDGNVYTDYPDNTRFRTMEELEVTALLRRVQRIRQHYTV